MTTKELLVKYLGDTKPEIENHLKIEGYFFEIVKDYDPNVELIVSDFRILTWPRVDKIGKESVVVFWKQDEGEDIEVAY